MIPPKKIYLQTCMECLYTDGSYPSECNECEFDNLAEVSWCKDKIFTSDEEYVRLEDAMKWLQENAYKYIYDSEVSRYKEPKLTISGKCWEDFKQAMMEE